MSFFKSVWVVLKEIRVDDRGLLVVVGVIGLSWDVVGGG